MYDGALWIAVTLHPVSSICTASADVDLSNQLNAAFWSQADYIVSVGGVVL